MITNIQAVLRSILNIQFRPILALIRRESGHAESTKSRVSEDE